MKQRTVLYSHNATYSDPIRVAKGEIVRLTGREDLWDGHRWLWAVAEDGKEGWVPLANLSARQLTALKPRPLRR